MNLEGKLAARFWAKVDVRTPSECWPWTGAITDGYGSAWIGAGTMKAHRVVYQLLVGDISPGSHLDHTCHNDSDCKGGPTCPHRACVNPSHLEPVSQLVNTQRGRGGGHNRDKTHCPWGHEYTPENITPQPGGRMCKRCNRERTANWRARKAGRAIPYPVYNTPRERDLKRLDLPANPPTMPS